MKAKKENGIYLLAFVCGIMLVNLLGNTTWANNSILNRYSLGTLSFREIVYEEYFLYILLLRFRTLAGIWLFSKLLPQRFVKKGAVLGISFLAGCVAAMSILANGIWGMWFFVVSLFPHGILYGGAYGIWYHASPYKIEGNGKSNLWLGICILLLVFIGCVCEAYIGPVLMEKVISR